MEGIIVIAIVFVVLFVILFLLINYTFWFFAYGIVIFGVFYAFFWVTEGRIVYVILLIFKVIFDILVSIVSYICQLFGRKTITSDKKIYTDNSSDGSLYTELISGIFGKGLYDKNYTYEELNEMPYHEYLETPHWQYVRNEAFKTYGRKCAHCGIDQNLHVHHKTYKHKGEEENHMSDLMVLCEECHGEIHDRN